MLRLHRHDEPGQTGSYMKIYSDLLRQHSFNQTGMNAVFVAAFEYLLQECPIT